jgi:hypothetical protein
MTNSDKCWWCQNLYCSRFQIYGFVNFTQPKIRVFRIAFFHIRRVHYCLPIYRIFVANFLELQIAIFDF